eukprot:2531161-Rhodomonas_salina.1
MAGHNSKPAPAARTADRNTQQLNAPQLTHYRHNDKRRHPGLRHMYILYFISRLLSLEVPSFRRPQTVLPYSRCRLCCLAAAYLSSVLGSAQRVRSNLSQRLASNPQHCIP